MAKLARYQFPRISDSPNLVLRLPIGGGVDFPYFRRMARSPFVNSLVSYLGFLKSVGSDFRLHGMNAEISLRGANFGTCSP